MLAALLFAILVALRPTTQARAEELSKPGSNLARLVERLQREYPDIRHRTLSEIRQQRDELVLVDVREPEEYAVSHIPGAVNLQDPTELRAFIANQPGEVVLYCSVGYRSAKLTRNLRNDGVSNVSNFAGSIFHWANSNEPLVSGEHPVSTVHPYSWF